MVATVCPGTSTLCGPKDARENLGSTDHRWVYDYTPTQLAGVVATGYRVLDLEPETPTASRLTATLVENKGAYFCRSWWFVGLTKTQLDGLIAANAARLIDLEPYEVGGSERFACVMVDNRGAKFVSTTYVVRKTFAEIDAMVKKDKLRVLDLDQYQLGSKKYYTAVMIKSTGALARPWDWQVNVTPAGVNTYLANSPGYRLYSLEHMAGDTSRHIALYVKDVTPQTSPWIDTKSTKRALTSSAEHSCRYIMAKRYTSGKDRRFLLVTIPNSKDLNVRAHNVVANPNNGTSGHYLKQVKGAVLAAGNHTVRFDPASGLKLLHLTHAFRQIFQGNLRLEQTTQTRLGKVGSCPTWAGPTKTETWSDVLRLMMEQSDNCRTRRVTETFGMAGLNATAVALGLTNTRINHHIGCGVPPNYTSLQDLGRIHEQVAANGYLGTFGSWRDSYYEHMLDDAKGDLKYIIDAEGQRLGLDATMIDAFIRHTMIARKGGSYTFGIRFWFSSSGWVRLPFLSAGRPAPREFVFGAFVANSLDEPIAKPSVKHASLELLRDQIRAALQTWLPNGKNIPAYDRNVGIGCRGFNNWHPAFGLTVPTAPPKLGSPYNYTFSRARPSSSGFLAFGDPNGKPFYLNGCALYISPLILLPILVDANGLSSTTLGIPQDSSLVGIELGTQAAIADPQGHWGGVMSLTNMRRISVGW